jgi:uncharacterized membrane protein
MSGVPIAGEAGAEPAEPILFEAVTRPPAGLSARGMRWVCGLATTAAAVPAVAFALLGAWPILGFLGGEVVLVLGLLALHRQWQRGRRETVLLTGGRLRVIRRDRGREERAELEPYWARLALAPSGQLIATARGRSVEIGRYLAVEEKQALAEALDAALGRYRSPRFDNPQLRD